MNRKSLDQLVFWENLKRAMLPSLVLVVFTTGYLAFSFNVPVKSEDVFGTVINVVPIVIYKGQSSAVTFVELDGGRVVSIPLPPTASLPSVGQRVTVVRYIKRFFGNSFGLKS
jgi:hypothetical protein